MKVEYKNIIGVLDKDSVSCFDCCFLRKMCIPFTILECRNHIFINGKTQIFDL